MFFIYLFFLICVLRLWFDFYIMSMDVVNVVIFYLINISDTTNDFLPGDNKRFTKLN